jgi:hypothetical protein
MDCVVEMTAVAVIYLSGFMETGSHSKVNRRRFTGIQTQVGNRVRLPEEGRLKVGREG